MTKKGTKNDTTGAKRTGIGSYIRKRRLQLQIPLSQSDLADKLHETNIDLNSGKRYSDAAIAHWESGTLPTLPPLNDKEFRDTLSTVLETTPYNLLREAGYLEGIGSPYDPDTWEIIQLLEQMPLNVRKGFLQAIRTAIGK